jgi:hypothetical protein
MHEKVACTAATIEDRGNTVPFKGGDGVDLVHPVAIWGKCSANMMFVKGKFFVLFHKVNRVFGRVNKARATAVAVIIAEVDIR